MDLKKKISRRQFIGQANCAAVGKAYFFAVHHQKTRPRQLDDSGPLRDAQLKPYGQSALSCERDVAWKVDRLVS